MNRVILIGRLGADPETRTTQSGTVIANLRLATNERRKNGDTWEDATEWHRVTVFGKTAENVARYCQKGKQLAIEGRIQTRKYQDKDGNDRYATEIVADTVEFVGDAGGSEPRQEVAKPASRGGYGSKGHSREYEDAMTAPEGVDDDIPF